MIYAKIENGVVVQYPVTGTDIVHQNKGVSFPDGVLSDSLMREFGCEPVSPTPCVFDEKTHRAIEGTPLQVNGIWYQVWDVIALTAEELAQRNAAQSLAVRLDRNERLAASDWTQLADRAAPYQALWVSYRQNLRDIPDQDGFPWDVTWPVEPGV